MGLNNKKKFQIFFYIIWFSLLLLQAIYTDLGNDETYYWKYSTKLAWGYFDHPPIIALLIRIGCVFFKNELGVRILIILLSTATIFFLEKIIEPTNIKLFYAIISSIAAFQVGGIIAVPDIPVIFFSVLFFYFYKKYLENDKWYLVIALPFTIALMLLSKYHGLLLIIFTIIANIKIIKRFSFWIIVGITAILLVPHLVWQINNDFATIKFQLIDRADSVFAIENVWEYIFTQPFVFGPLIGILLMYFSFKRKPENTFEKVLRINLYGIYIFFFIMTFKESVEANWTIIACLPLIFAGYKEIEKRVNVHKTVFILFWISLPIIILFRIFLIHDFLPFKNNILSEYHDSQKWANAIQKVAKDKPVVFTQSYSKATKYEFYTGCPAISFNYLRRRKDQFNIWDSEADLQGKTVMLDPSWKVWDFDSINTVKGAIFYTFIKNFRSFSNVKVSSKENIIYINNKNSLNINVRFDYLNNNKRDFEANKETPTYIFYRFDNENKLIVEKKTELLIKNNMINNGQYYNFTVELPNLEKGIYRLLISLKTGRLEPTVNSAKIKIIVQ